MSTQPNGNDIKALTGLSKAETAKQLGTDLVQVNYNIHIYIYIYTHYLYI